MPRKRDYKAEYAARNAKARQVGYKSYRDMRNRRAAKKPLRQDVGFAPIAISTAAGTLVRVGSESGFRRALRDIP